MGFFYNTKCVAVSILHSYECLCNIHFFIVTRPRNRKTKTFKGDFINPDFKGLKQFLFLILDKIHQNHNLHQKV